MSIHFKFHLIRLDLATTVFFTKVFKQNLLVMLILHQNGQTTEVNLG